MPRAPHDRGISTIPSPYAAGRVAQLVHATEVGDRNERIAMQRCVMQYISALEHYCNPLQIEHAVDLAKRAEVKP